MFTQVFLFNTSFSLFSSHISEAGLFLGGSGGGRGGVTDPPQILGGQIDPPRGIPSQIYDVARSGGDVAGGR